ncbi:spondin domain-containing protein [Neorhodopirellula pilleata]|nr:spondin domain-containing protein [Neorhodopirellula pilleata]
MRRGIRLETLERRQLLAAEVLQISVENLSVEGGLANTPLWIGAHDGNFEIGRIGQAANDFGGLEELAEEGDVAPLRARFANEAVGNDGVLTAPLGFAGAPIFEPGETVTQTFTVDDTTLSPYFSYASMLIPSNDAFIANLNSRAIRLFDETGQFTGNRTIEIYGSQVWDAGTEVNAVGGGPAFVIDAGTSTDENGLIHLHEGLDNFIGVGLPTGEPLRRAFADQTPIARISISLASKPSGPEDASGPSPVLSADDLVQRSDYHEISVTYRDPSGVDLTSISPANLRITGPLLTQLDVVSVSTDAPSSAITSGTPVTEVTATYRLSPSTLTSSGTFTSLDNGTYSVVLLDRQVNDSFGIASSGQRLGEFTVDAPVRLTVTFESLADDGGLRQTPLWIGTHNGNFEIARAGRPASDFGGLEELAEEGALDALIARFRSETVGNGGVITAPSGFAGAPVFEPGEVFSGTLDVDDPTTNRFFSYASMVIPSNDAFIANLDPRGIELFNQSGQFTGTRTITIYGQDIWDAGTEVNGSDLGAAFSSEGGTSIDENGVIRRHLGLDEFVDTGLVSGETLRSAFDQMTPIGRITIAMSDTPTLAIDQRGPLATADAPSLIGQGQSTHLIRVTYSDASGIDRSSVGVDDLKIVSTTGRELQVVGITIEPANAQSSRNLTAIYEIAPVDGNGFSTEDNGLYFVSLNESEVGDGFGNQSGVTALASFEVRVAVELEITVENLTDIGGLAQTPFWIGVHDGSFQVARAGVSASEFGGLELLAEEGDVSELAARFSGQSDGVGGVVLAPGGFAGAPVFEPGESVTEHLQVFDTNQNRFFSFASMVIPSNDAFIANLNPRAYELFDHNGFFTGPRTITIYGSDIWDAGTEQNGISAGAAFSTLPGDGVDENGVIQSLSSLNEFIGTPIASGGNLESAFRSRTPIARITIGIAGQANSVVDSEGPLASASALSIEVAGTASQTITVVYNDPSGIDLTSIDTDDIRVTGSLNRELTVTDASTNAIPGTTPNTVAVTYTVATSDGAFTARDNGVYSIALTDDGPRDTFGQAATRGRIGTFNVDVGVRLQVNIETLTEIGGLSQTPFWVGFHDGSFEIARTGRLASDFPGLELIAEEGDASELIERFQIQTDGTGALLTAPGGFPGAPVFEPGESSSQILEISDTRENRFFSFASMIIPSNDAFIANLNPTSYELFDSAGNFRGERRITIFGRDVYDAGTEVNSAVGGGAAFSPDSGDGMDENSVIRRHLGLDDFIGTGLPTGSTLGSAFGPLTPLAVLTVSLHDPEAHVCSGVDGACSVRSVSLQNTQNNVDVNRDGSVTALDALLVINFLNEFGSRETVTDEAQRFGVDLDVGGDSVVSELDALLVINELNRRTASQAAGESVRPTHFGDVEAVDAVLVHSEGLAGAFSSDDDELDDVIAMLF